MLLEVMLPRETFDISERPREREGSRRVLAAPMDWKMFSATI